MSAGGVTAVVSVEGAKLVAQVTARVVLVFCLAGPFAFAVAIRLQSSVPEDTLFGRAVKESGSAVSLVVLGFAALWIFPVVAAIIGGDVFSSEDRYGTWKTVLTRSRSRSELFIGKVLTALAFSSLALAVLAASSVAAGWLVVGPAQLIDLSGVLNEPSQALGRVALAWTSVLPPIFGFTALAVMLSVATRSSAAGIGLPVAAALAMQVYAFVDGPEWVRRVLLTTAFVSWHGLFTEPSYYRPLVDGTVVSLAYFVVCLAVAYRTLQRRDIGG